MLTQEHVIYRNTRKDFSSCSRFDTESAGVARSATATVELLQSMLSTDLVRDSDP
jgi:hypothetical protein